ncbi:MAG: hypothetical protein KGO92_12685, partial [Bacteroidota bacterium]|nr:hypothetical protein [Bacteroidota bacterium]
MHKFSIKAWAKDDQPGNKLLQKGVNSLSNSELLAILINTGTTDHSALDIAKQILLHTDNDLQKLGNMSVQELVLKKVKGLGES